MWVPVCGWGFEMASRTPNRQICDYSSLCQSSSLHLFLPRRGLTTDSRGCSAEVEIRDRHWSSMSSISIESRAWFRRGPGFVEGVVSSRAFCGGTNTQKVCAEDCGGWRGLVPNFQDFWFPWVIRDRPSPPSASSPSSLYSLYTLFILSFKVINSKVIVR